MMINHYSKVIIKRLLVFKEVLHIGIFRLFTKSKGKIVPILIVDDLNYKLFHAILKITK
jgi:hypothetical protein